MDFNYDLTEERVCFLGRYQPLHDGHEMLIRTKLDQGHKVVVQVRSMKQEKDNPYNYSEVWDMFYKRFKEEMENGDLLMSRVPNIVTICHGRKTGWNVEQIHLPEDIEKISATNIRNQK